MVSMDWFQGGLMKFITPSSRFNIHLWWIHSCHSWLNLQEIMGFYHGFFFHFSHDGFSQQEKPRDLHQLAELWQFRQWSWSRITGWFVSWFSTILAMQENDKNGPFLDDFPWSSMIFHDSRLSQQTYTRAIEIDDKHDDCQWFTELKHGNSPY